jgi:hypothetical protein
MNRAQSLKIGAAALGLSLAAGGASAGQLPAADGPAGATAPARLVFGVYSGGDRAVLQQAQFVLGGRSYCWYGSAWSGPGFYWCGYAWRNGYG